MEDTHKIILFDFGFWLEDYVRMNQIISELFFIELKITGQEQFIRCIFKWNYSKLCDQIFVFIFFYNKNWKQKQQKARPTKN